MTEGVVLVRRRVFEEVGRWESSIFLYHEGLDLAYRFWSAGYTGWYAAEIRMHHPVSSPARHPQFYRLASRNRISVAYCSLPRPLIPLYLAVWTAITLVRAVSGGGTRESLAGMREGWARRRDQVRRPMSWRTVGRLTRAARPPVI
ncbi:glycosyltransferase family 2 protein [Streptomyces sp. NPDC059802]|uniref:glycosyltransferase family 2 protein n=1 Tax=Streptomyces sp. NPDC059802 TaxID=3346952 RepID=UPI0036682B9C